MKTLNLELRRLLVSIRRLLERVRAWPQFVVALVLTLCVSSAEALADAKSQLAKEAAEYVVQRFGRKVVTEGTEVLARRIEIYAARHGDEFFMAVRRVGPRAFELTEAAGVNAPKAVRVMAQHGEEGVAAVLSRPKGMALLTQHGESAAAALVRHPGIGEPVIEKFGSPGIKALQVMRPQGGRRLAMMLESGALKKIGRSEEVLDVISKFGDRGMDFVWKNKESLAISAALIAFLADPEPFINGTKDITKIVAENVAQPLAAAPAHVAEEAARRTNWTPIVLVVVLAVIGFIGVKTGLMRKAFWELMRAPSQSAQHGGTTEHHGA